MESTENEVLMDEVTEQRPVEKKRSYLGTVIFLVILTLVASAIWYFQSAWMPHAKKTYLQAQTVMHDFMSSEKMDPMAAPAMSSAMDVEGAAEPEDNTEIVVSASIATKSADEEKTEIKPVMNDVAVEEGQENKQTTEANSLAQNANKEKPAIEIHADVKATFVDQTTVAKQDPVKAEEVKEIEVLASKPLEQAENPQAKVNLAAARQAFWQRDLPKAEALYKEQIKNNQANANSWGELGNIYYLQAKWQQAASAYTEAALLLLDKGDFPQAMFLRYVIYGLDATQVKRIDERLRAMQAPLHG